MRSKIQSKTTFRVYKAICLLLILTILLPTSTLAAPAQQADPEPPTDPPAAPLDVTATPVRRVNAPFFSGDVRLIESAIFWFGRVNGTDNYADVRVGYNATNLVIRVAVMDRLLRHDPTPTAAELTQYDAVSLYLNLSGNSGTAPTNQAYRLVGMLAPPANQTAAKAVYRGNGTAWAPATLSFSANSSWRGNALNDNINDRGWSQEFIIPFTSLGLAARPPDGTVWGLALTLHDRDDAAGTPITVQTWPTGVNTSQPSTWGQLNFGLPVYSAPSTPARGIVVIREGLNGAIVPDAAVGGTIGALCVGDESYMYNRWGEANFGSQPRFNLQNQGDIADWPCFAKYYLRFPLSQVPAGKAILSATLTLHQFGGSDPSRAQRSLIQVFSLSEDWSESTLTWNNAPLALENVSRAWADVVSSCNWPCAERTWNVSLAAASAYSAGSTSLSLAMYEADSSYHSGKHFIASEEPAWNAVARPTLTIVWGDPPARLTMSAWPPAPQTGQTVDFTLHFTGSGENLSLTNTLPTGLGEPVSSQASLGELTYQPAGHLLTWSGTPASGQEVVLTFGAPVVASGHPVLTNQASLQGSSHSSQALVDLPVNGFTLLLPALMLSP